MKMRHALQAAIATGLATALTAAAPGTAAPRQTAAPPPTAQTPKQLARDAVATPAPVGTAVIAGTLVDAGTGKPVRRARVNLSSREPRIARNAITDVQGRFTFTALPAGEYTVSASQPGYLDVTYGQKRPGAGGLGTPVHLVDRQRLDTLTLRIPHGGVLTGTVIDENGDPVFGTEVRALRYVMKTGERAPEPAGAARTDDRGIYRIPALPPGDYIVSATPREVVTAAAAAAAASDPVKVKATAAAKPARAAIAAPDPEATPPDGYAPVFYPGTTVASSAQAIALDVSQEHAGVDLQLQLVPMARIDGTLTGAGGPLQRNVQIDLIATDAVQISRSARTTRPAAGGAFSFSALAPGRYSLMARAVVPRADSALAQARAQGQSADPAVKRASRAAGDVQLFWALTEVVIDGHDVANVVLTLQPGMTVSGHVVFQGTKAPPADMSRVRVTIEPAGHTPASEISTVTPAQVGADGTFTLTDVVPGLYRLGVAGQAGAAGWTLASAVVAGRDTLDSALEVRPTENVTGAVVTFTDRQTTLSGTLQDAAGQATAEYFVVVFAADEKYWTPQSRRIQAARPGTDGHFAFRGLPPGEYRVVALADVEQGAWYDPTVLRQLVGPAVSITLAEGAAQVQDLRISK